MNRMLLALPLILVAACGNEPDVKMENASIGEVAQEMRGAKTASALKPGKWEHIITLIEMDMPGMPADAKAMMKETMKQQRFEHCLTPEQSDRPKEDFFTQAGQNCRFEHYEWGNGKIDMKLNCAAPEGRMTMVQTGEYRSDGYSMAMSQVFEGAGSTPRMTIKAKVDAKRIGECDGKEKIQAGS